MTVVRMIAAFGIWFVAGLAFWMTLVRWGARFVIRRQSVPEGTVPLTGSLAENRQRAVAQAKRRKQRYATYN